MIIYRDNTSVNSELEKMSAASLAGEGFRLYSG